MAIHRVADRQVVYSKWLDRGQHGFDTVAYTKTDSLGGTGLAQSLIYAIAFFGSNLLSSHKQAKSPSASKTTLCRPKWSDAKIQIHLKC